MPPQVNGAPSPAPLAAVMSPRSALRIAMDNKNYQQSQSQHQPYQVVNAPPTPPVYAAKTVALVDVGTGVLQVPPSVLPQPQEGDSVVNDGGSDGPPPCLVAGGGPPVHDGKCDVAGSSFWGYRD